ncbi:STY4851/ECs_5259 family protein [Vibrio inusitatus]|nr:STY4851/ECs_5259 family protein [Vibrio inusitatus]
MILDGVQSPVVTMQQWFNEFESKRPKPKKGMPLWALKVTDEELQQMNKLLKALFRAKEPSIIFNQHSCSGYGKKFDQIFTLYLATWIQRNFTGGKERWPVVLRSIDISHSNRLNTYIYDSVRAGLKYWGLDLYSTSSANQYFATLYCQGGFPRSGLVGLSSGPVPEYLDKVISQYALFHHTSEISDISHQQLQLLPETLKQPPFAKLATVLITKLMEYRDTYHLHGESDPVIALDVRYPQWRDELPFLLCDEEAHELIGRLVRRTSAIIRREQNPVRIKRYLREDMGHWDLVAETYVNHTIHPQDLSRVLSLESLPKFFDLYTHTNTGERVRTASFNLKGYANKRWQVITKFAHFYNADAASNIGYELWSDGHKFNSDTYYRGEELNKALPWIFSAEGEKSQYLGQGNVQVKQSAALIVHSGTVEAANSRSKVEKAGTIASLGRDVYRVVGKAKVELDYGFIEVTTGAEEAQDVTCWLEGQRNHEAISHQHVFEGKPTGMMRFGVNKSQPIPSEELFWKSVDSDSLVPLNSEAFSYGLGSIVWFNAGQVMWQMKCAILPASSDFNVINYGRGEIELKAVGFNNTDLGFVENEKNWLRDVDVIEDMFFAEVQIPASMPDTFHPVLGWNNSPINTLTFEFDSLQSGVCLLGSNGNTLNARGNNITLDDLYASSLKVKLNQEASSISVSAALMQHKRIKASVTDVIQIPESKTTIGSGELARMAQALFTQSDDTRDRVSFKFYSGRELLESRVPPIVQFKYPVASLKENHAMLRIYGAHNHSNPDSIELYTAPIWDLSREHTPLLKSEGDRGELFFELPEINEPGPWFVYSKNERKIQPRAVMVPQQESEETSYDYTRLQLSIKDLSFDPETRSFDYLEMDASLRELILDLQHRDWQTVQSFVEQLAVANPTTFHIFKRLSANPDVFAALLLKQESLEEFESVWSISLDMPFEWLNVSLRQWIEAISLTTKSTMDSLMMMKAQLPAAQFEQIQNTMLKSRLQNLSDKGEYYAAIVEASLFILYGITPSWLDMPIYSSEQEPSHIADFHKQKSEYYCRQEGRLLTQIQNKHNDIRLKEILDSRLSRDLLGAELKGFTQHYSVDKSKAMRLAIPLELPVKVALNNAGVYPAADIDEEESKLINFALNRLSQFDRVWMQESMAIAIKSAVKSRAQ